MPIWVGGHPLAVASCAETCFQALANRFLTQGGLLLLDTQGRVFSWRDLVFCGVCRWQVGANFYYYCKMCDRPLSSQDYGTQGNYTAAGNTKTVYCRFCASVAEGRKVPYNSGTCVNNLRNPLIYLLVGNEPLALGIPAPAITILLGAFYLATHFQDKSNYSPIYDRWVMEHGMMTT